MVELEFAGTPEAPRQMVWDAWTDPDQLAQWWDHAASPLRASRSSSNC